MTIYRRQQEFWEAFSRWLAPEKLRWILAAIAVVLLAPAFVFNRYYPNVDLEVHYRMLVQFADSLREGVLQPRWAAIARGGLGEPMPVYYSPVIYYWGGLFMLAGFSSWTAMKIVVASGLVAAALAMYRLCRPWMSESMALLAAFTLPFCPLVLLLEFSTANVAWMAGMCWGILLLSRCLEWGSLRRPDSQWLDPWFAVFIAMLTLTHILSVVLVLATAPIAALAAGHWFPAWRRFLVSSFTGIALAGFYFWPAVSTMHMITPSKWVGEDAYREHFNFPLLYRLGGGATPWVTIQVLLSGLLAAGLIMLAVWMWRRRAEASVDPTWRPMAALLGAGLLALFLSTELSLTLWRLFRPLAFLQFPWRFLYIVLFVFCAVSAYAIGRGFRLPAWIVAVSLLLGVAYLAKMYVSAGPTEYTPAMLNGMFGVPEYRTAVPGNPTAYLAAGGFPAECAAAAAICQELDHRTHYRRWRVTAARPVSVRLPVFAYPAWGVRRNGVQLPVVPDPDTGLAPVSLEPGVQEVELFWSGLAAERAGRYFSLAGLVIVAAGFIAGRRR